MAMAVASQVLAWMTVLRQFLTPIVIMPTLSSQNPNCLVHAEYARKIRWAAIRIGHAVHQRDDDLSPPIQTLSNDKVLTNNCTAKCTFI